MFFRKAKEIEDLKFLLSIFYERNKSQTDLIRVHLNTNRRLKKEKRKMSYEQISESTYYQNMSYWNQVAQNYRALGGLGICDDETGEELYTV